MRATELAKLNHILADRMGRMENGTPKFRFMWSGDLMFPVRTGTREVGQGQIDCAKCNATGVVLEQQFEEEDEQPVIEEVECRACKGRKLVPRIISFEPVSEMQPQLPGDEPTWCIAKWIEPPSRDRWEQDYGKVLGYPENGYWFMIAMLKPGKVPSEEWAHWAARHLNSQREMDYLTTVRLIEAARERKQEKYRKDVVDIFRETVAYHIPGKRGGSYLAFNEKGT